MILKRSITVVVTAFFVNTMLMAAVLFANDESKPEPYVDVELKQQLQGMDLSCEIFPKSGNLFVRLKVPNQRNQGVTLESTTFQHEGQQYRVIRSTAAFSYHKMLATEVLSDLLLDNHERNHGAWSLQHTAKDYYVAEFRTTIRTDISDKELLDKLTAVAEIADKKEEQHMAGFDNL